MGGFVKGHVVVVPYPYGNATGGKVRPAIVVAKPVSSEAILCMITSTHHEDGYSVDIGIDDFESGQLRHMSYARVRYLFTIPVDAIRNVTGKLTPQKTFEIVNRIIAVLQE